MSKSTGNIVGIVIVAILAIGVAWLMAFSHLQPALVRGAEFNPEWLSRYRAIDLVVLAIVILAAVAGVSALFPSERSTIQQFHDVRNKEE